jgi:hypothetical protein
LRLLRLSLGVYREASGVYPLQAFLASDEGCSAVVGVVALIFTLGLVLALLVLGIWEASRIMVSACQWFLSRRPFSGRRVTSTCSLPGEGDHDGLTRPQPKQYRTTHGRSLSSPSPACCTPDLESGGVTHRLLAPFALVAAIDPAPNMDAFGAGVQIMVFTALATIAALVVIAWIVKTMRGGQ